MFGSMIHARLLVAVFATSSALGFSSAIHGWVAISHASQLPGWLGTSFMFFESLLILQAIGTVILLGLVVYWSVRVARIAGFNRNYLFSAIMLFASGFVGFYLGNALAFGAGYHFFEGLAPSVGYEGIILLVGLVLTLPLQLLLSRHR